MEWLTRIYHLPPIHNHRREWFLILAGFLFVMLRIPSLVEPWWYGDEGIYQVVGKAIRNGSLLYRDIWDNKPPILYLIYAAFDGELYWVKLASLIAGLLSIGSFFLLSKKLLTNGRHYIATLLYAVLFGLPLIEGNIANAENFMLLPTTTALYFAIRYLKEKNLKFIIIAGFLLSISFMMKAVAVFDFLAILFILLAFNIDKTKQISIKNFSKEFLFTLSFLFLSVFTSIYFFAKGAFADFFGAVLSQNIDYVSSENIFIFPMGTLIIKSILAFIFLLILFVKRNGLGKNKFIIYVWLVFAFYSALFSQRGYTHYFLLVLPAFCLLVANIRPYSKKIILDGMIVFVLIFAAFNYFKIYGKTLGYYKNYLDFIGDGKSVERYQSFFDSFTPRDYEIVRFIKTNLKNSDQIFLWSDSAQIYALADIRPIGKYTVSYHITFYDKAMEETKKMIEKKQPRYIIQTKENGLNMFLPEYSLRYRIQGAKIYEREI